MAIRYSNEDISIIKGRMIETGYDSEADWKEMGHNFHAGDDDAYAEIAATELSYQAVEDILNSGSEEIQIFVKDKLPENFDLKKLSFKFKWNCEWGDWSDVIYDGRKVWDFISGLNKLYYHE